MDQVAHVLDRFGGMLLQYKQSISYTRTLTNLVTDWFRRSRFSSGLEPSIPAARPTTRFPR